MKMSRIPLPYSCKLLDLFRNPKNIGKMEDATVSAVAGSPACGDMIVFYLKIDENDLIEKATFESYGCAANIATASITTEMIKGINIEQAWKISWKDIADEVGSLPTVKFHCGILSVGALKRTIREYFKKKGVKPSWMSNELTLEEKHALEEEELAKALSKKLKKK
jgi:nitrogen fixation NifU-like protein